MTRTFLALLALFLSGCQCRYSYTRVRAHVCCHCYGSVAVDVEHDATYKE